MHQLSISLAIGLPIYAFSSGKFILTQYPGYARKLWFSLSATKENTKCYRFSNWHAKCKKKVNTNRVFECKIQHHKPENYKIQIAGKQPDICEMCVFNIYLVNMLLLPPCKIHLLKKKTLYITISFEPIWKYKNMQIYQGSGGLRVSKKF